MPQWFRLDRPVALAYVALGLWGCSKRPPALVPPGMQVVSAEQAARWVAATAPRAGALHRFKWSYQDENAAKGGRGSARIALPDTLRFDIAGSLGIGKGSAFVVGDSALWVVPEKSVEDLVPSFPLLWAMFGVARAPGSEDRLAGLETEGRTAWQYANGADTVNYLRVPGTPVTFFSEVRHAGRVTGLTTDDPRPGWCAAQGDADGAECSGQTGDHVLRHGSHAGLSCHDLGSSCRALAPSRSRGACTGSRAAGSRPRSRRSRSCPSTI